MNVITRRSQQSQECNDPCCHCFCDLWPWPFDPNINGLIVGHNGLILGQFLWC